MQVLCIPKRKTLVLQKPKQDDSSDSETEETIIKRRKIVPSSFRASKSRTANKLAASAFVLDTHFGNEAAVVEEEETVKSEEGHTEEAETVMDKKLEELLSKARCGPAFEKASGQTANLFSKRALKKQKQIELEKTKGKNWFDLPATELTEEARADLELLQMRAALDPQAHYRRNDRTVLPKYFQVGRVVDAPEDYYSSRIVKKDRKRTMVDELLNDMDFQRKKKAAYNTIMARESKKVRGAFQRSGPRQRVKKPKEGRGKKAAKN